MAWRQKKDNNTENENRFNKFFKKNESRFNNKIYERNFTNDNESENKNDNKKSNDKISYHNGFDPTRDNNNNKNYFRNNYRSNYKSNYRSNYRSNYNKDSFPKKNQEPKSTTQIINDEISNIEKQLASNKYMTKIKKDELEKKIKELNIKKINEFPQLSDNSHINLEPKVSCWNNLSQSKIYTINCSDKVSEKKKKNIYEEHVESDYDGDDFIDDDNLMDEEKL